MDASPQNSPRAAKVQMDTGGFPWGPLVICLLCFVGLTASTVLGALSSNARAGAFLLRTAQHDKEVADELGIDAAAIGRGRTAYAGTCTACHGPNGEAKPNLGKQLSDSEFIGGKSIAELHMFIKLGRSTWDTANTTGVAMPPKGGNPMLTDDNMKDIAAFLLFLQV